MEITKLYDAAWSFDEGGVRFFLLEGSEAALLLDSGMRTSDARDQAARLTDKPIYYMNTHADRDHIGSDAQFDRVLMHPAERENYARSGGKAEVEPITDGQIVDLGGRELMVIHIPGHTPGSIALLDLRNRALFSGDTVSEANIYMFGPMRNIEDFLKSLEKLASMTERFDRIYPCHGTAVLTPDAIMPLHDAARSVLRGEIDGEPVTLHGQDIMLYSFPHGGLFYDGHAGFVRPVRRDEYRATEELTRTAFYNVYRPGAQEHYLVHRFRDAEDYIPEYDLVLERAGIPIGHALMVRSLVTLADGSTQPILTLGPISVAPNWQKRGLGLCLLNGCIRTAREQGEKLIALEGDPAFYGKAGFTAGRALGVTPMDDADAPYFLVKMLSDDAPQGSYAVPDGYFAADREQKEF